MPTPDQIANRPPKVDPRAAGLTFDEGGRPRGKGRVSCGGWSVNR